jgi:hypothetical protein
VPCTILFHQVDSLKILGIVNYCRSWSPLRSRFGGLEELEFGKLVSEVVEVELVVEGVEPLLEGDINKLEFEDGQVKRLLRD